MEPVYFSFYIRSGTTYSVAVAARVFGSLYADPIVNCLGIMNTIVLAEMVYCLRLYLYAVIR